MTVIIDDADLSSCFLQTIKLQYILICCSIISNGDLWFIKYRQTLDVRHSLVADKFAYHSDVVGASFVGATPTTASFST